MKGARFVKTRLLMVLGTSLAIPAMASMGVNDVTPEKLSESGIVYFMSVCIIVLSGTVASLFYTLIKQSIAHRKELRECYNADREDRRTRDENFGRVVEANTEALSSMKTVILSNVGHH